MSSISKKNTEKGSSLLNKNLQLCQDPAMSKDPRLSEHSASSQDSALNEHLTLSNDSALSEHSTLSEDSVLSEDSTLRKDTPYTKSEADPEQVEEIISDGSASAFEGTELWGQDDRDEDLLKRIQKHADPSGRSDY